MVLNVGDCRKMPKEKMNKAKENFWDSLCKKCKEVKKLKKEIKELKKDNKKYIIRWSKDTESLLNKLKQKDKKIKELEQTLTKLRNKYLDIKGELENAIPRGISPYYDIVQKILKRLKK